MTKTPKIGDAWKARNEKTELNRISTEIQRVMDRKDFKNNTRLSYKIDTQTARSLSYSQTVQRLTAEICRGKFNIYTKFIFSHSRKGRYHPKQVFRFYTIELSPLPFK